MSFSLDSEFAEAGFVCLPPVSSAELTALRDLIKDKYHRVLQPTLVNVPVEMHATHITRYHEISNYFDHSAVWDKSARLFSAEEVQIFIEDFSFLRSLEDLLGVVEIADIEKIGYPEIYWRIVRPGVADVAPAHKDSWFWSVTNNLSVEAQRGLAKIWIPIWSEPNVSGLAVSPGSHKIEIPFGAELRHGRLKPTVDPADLNQIDFKLLRVLDGGMILFDRELLHRGFGSDSRLTRISLEFAIRSPAIRY
jgi:hypothetical protein